MGSWRFLQFLGVDVNKLTSLSQNLTGLWGIRVNMFGPGGWASNVPAEAFSGRDGLIYRLVQASCHGSVAIRSRCTGLRQP